MQPWLTLAQVHQGGKMRSIWEQFSFLLLCLFLKRHNIFSWVIPATGHKTAQKNENNYTEVLHDQQNQGFLQLKQEMANMGSPSTYSTMGFKLSLKASVICMYYSPTTLTEFTLI